jgi:predicted transcriptional regulator
MTMRNAKTGLRIDPSTMARLHSLAIRRGSSAENLLAEALLPYLAREDAFERERVEDKARYQNYLRTGEAFDHSDVAAWLDSLGTDQPLSPPHRLG